MYIRIIKEIPPELAEGLEVGTVLYVEGHAGEKIMVTTRKGYRAALLRDEYELVEEDE